VPSSFSSSSIAISYISFTKQFKRRIKPNHTLLSAAATPDNDIISAPPTISPSNNKHPNSNLNRNEPLFQERIQQLRTFQKKYGHGSIPSPYKPNPSLGIWAANLRRQHTLSLRAEETNRPYIGYLTSERYQTLIKEGFDFTSLTERQFQLRLVELQEFKVRFGHCNVPEKWDENIALGAWVSNIRSLYKRRHIQQQTNNKAVLKEDTPKKQKMVRRNRNILLHKAQPNIKKRKRSSRFSHLDDERIQLLESMGFVWSANDRKWYEMLEWCKVYGILNRYLDDSKLISHDVDSSDDSNGGEIDLQQATADIKNELNHTLLLDKYHHFIGNIQNQSIISTFHPPDEILPLFLDESYAQQNDVEYIPSSLDYRISPNDTLHYPLRIWMINQRSNYNRLDRSSSSSERQQLPPTFSSSMIPSTMTQQRQEALESINFPWSGRFPNRMKEVQYEQEKLAEIERQKEKERRIEEKERKERERVEQLTSRRDDVGGVNEPVDVMALWQAGDDEDDDDW